MTARAAKEQPREPSIARAAAALEEVYSAANARFYDGALPPVALTLAPAGRRNAYGWCTTAPVWSTADGSVKLVEVNMSAEHLHRPEAETVATLLHEMVHVYHVQTGVKGTSRQNRYHNKRFQADALAHGLTCAHDERIGWSLTALNETAAAWLADLEYDRDGLTLARQSEGGGKKAKTVSSFRKHTCPTCGLTARTTRDATLVCFDCEQVMSHE